MNTIRMGNKDIETHGMGMTMRHIQWERDTWNGNEACGMRHLE